MRQLSDIVLNQKPVTLAPETPVQQACLLMREGRVGSVLVTDSNNNLVGIFTGRDAVHRVAASAKDAATTVLAEVMTETPVTMSPHNTAIEALRLMWDGGFRHIPVVEEGRILGVVSRGDFNANEEDRLQDERNLWEHML